jgi:hypothetical protein
MEVLSKLGFTAEEITKLSSGTEDEQTAIIERVKGSIIDGVKNDPKLFDDYKNKGYQEATLVTQKKIAKALGVSVDKEDTIDSVLAKGKELLQANGQETAIALQNELIAIKEKYTDLETVRMPGELAKVRDEVNQVYIDMTLNSSASKLDKSLLTLEDRVLIGKQKLASMGLVAEYDPTEKKTLIKQKANGLQPQIGDKTFKFDEVDAIMGTVLDSYNQKSNSASPGTSGVPSPGAVATSTMVGSRNLTPQQQAKIDMLNSLGAK